MLAQYIINPLTHKNVKVGGRTYQRLVNDNIIMAVKEKDDNILFEVNEGTPEDEKKNALENAKKVVTLPIGYQAVHGRGKYKDKIVKRRLSPNVEDIKTLTAKVSAKLISENGDSLYDSDISDSDLEEIIKKLLDEEIAKK